MSAISICHVSMFLLMSLGPAVDGCTQEAMQVDGSLVSDEGQPKIVARSDKSLMHCLFGDGLMITRTDLESGEMRYVLCTGIVENDTRRKSFSMSRIVGCHQAREFLLVVVYNSGRAYSERKDELRFDPSLGNYMIHVIDAGSGKPLDRFRFAKRELFPASIPVATGDRGVIEPNENGFHLFGTEFRLDDDGKVRE